MTVDPSTSDPAAEAAPFESLAPVPTAEELLDKAFSRAARTGRAKSGAEA